MEKQSGEASNMKPGGSHEESRQHVNHPFRDLHKGGHDLNERYKVPAANPSGQNHSYMHPLEHNPSGFTGKENAPKILQPGMPGFVTGKDKGQKVGPDQASAGSKTIPGKGPVTKL